MKLFSALFSFFLIFTATSAYAQSNENIFVPIPSSNESSVQNQHSSPLSQLISLQLNLYKVVLTFDERAKKFENAHDHFETMLLQARENQMVRNNDAAAQDPIHNIPGYSAVVKEPTLCAELDNALKSYIKKHSQDLTAVVTQLTAETQNYSEQQKAETASFIHSTLKSSGIDIRRSEEILYLCLYRYKNELGVPRNYSVEKTLREWFTIQAPLVDLWIGPVD